MVTLLPFVATSSVFAYDLRCEALENPLAIETSKPVLSWKLKETSKSARNLQQTSYEILVATSPAKLQGKRADLWRSGRVQSGETFNIPYKGRALRPGEKAFWTVRVWDQKSAPSKFANAATFSAGLKTWSANWIHGATPGATQEALKDATWIGPSSSSKTDAPAGTYVFTRRFDLAKPTSGKIQLTADNIFTLTLNGVRLKATTDPEGWRKPETIDLTRHLKAGSNVLEVSVNNVSAGPTGLLAALTLVDAGKATTVYSDRRWESDGRPAREIGKNGVGPWNAVRDGQLVKAPAQYFRKSFRSAGKVTRATAYVTALGIVDFSVNGKRVSEDLFTPGWTNYAKRTHYRAFDITKSLKPGENQLGAILGQGWYAGYIAWGLQREHYGSTPMLKAQVVLEYANGSKQTIKTDGTWQVAEGQILDEHFLHGEKYDARKAPANWKPAKLGKYATKLEAFPGNPVRAYQTVRAKSIKRQADGRYLINFGQNLSGFVRLKAKESAGKTISIRHAERLDKDGRVYTTNLRAAQAIDTYTFASNAVETWNPRFTFHGFQYIEVAGLSKPPTPETFQAIAISSDTPEVGTLRTSDTMLNTLVKNAWWTQKMNFVDVPTDCPQRDERLGWTGDAQAYVETAAYYSDVQAFFKKWLVTLDDDQRKDGQYPKVAPVLGGLDDGGPAWADAGVICPMAIYDSYGDKELLARHYPNMKRFIAFCKNRSKSNLLPPDQFHCFGDWLSIRAETPNDVIAQAYFAGSVALVARAARELGKTEDEAMYIDLQEKVKKAFQDAYVTAEGKVKGETQCAYVLALGFDLLPESKRSLAAAHLIKDIESRNWHLSTGFVGTRDLMHVLSKIGRNDVAFRLLHNTTFPSWGFTIVNGATSIWERWDGWTPEKGFQDAGMNSFAHYAYGAVAGWMYKTIGGISPVTPGYGTIRIAPQYDPRLNWAVTTYNSVRGPIRTSWKRTGAKVVLTVQVPPNTRAAIEVPGSNGTVERHNVGSGTWIF